MKKNLISLGILIISIIIFVSIYIAQNDTRNHFTMTNITTSYARILNLDDSPVFSSGIAAGITSYNWVDSETLKFYDNLTKYHSHSDWLHPGWFSTTYIKSAENPTIVYFIENHERERREFMIQILINYEPISFRFKDSDEYIYSLEFYLDSNYEMRFPLVLNKNIFDQNKVYELTIITFVEPHSDPQRQLFMEMATSSTLIFGEYPYNFNRARTFSRDFNFIPDNRIDFPLPLTGFGDIRVNSQQLDINPDEVQVAYSPATVFAKPGEIIELAYFINPSVQQQDFYNELYEYVVFAFLDWKPIHLNDEPFLFVDVSNSPYSRIVDHGVFTIRAPEVPGVYAFIAYVSPNVLQPRTIYNNWPLDASVRFNIIVEE